jgi:hypothetical protein
MEDLSQAGEESLRRLEKGGGQRLQQIWGQGHTRWRRQPGGGGGVPGERRVGVNEGNRLGCPHPDPLTQGENR